MSVVYCNKYLFLFLSLRYKAIVKYKTAFYSFYLPVAAAMYMVSVSTSCCIKMEVK